MSLLTNVLNGNLKCSSAAEDSKGAETKDIDADMQPTEIFEGGHKLTALENIGSSLTTLWSNCSLKVISSKNSLKKETNPKRESNTANDIQATIREDIAPSDLNAI